MCVLAVYGLILCVVVGDGCLCLMCRVCVEYVLGRVCVLYVLVVCVIFLRCILVPVMCA